MLAGGSGTRLRPITYTRAKQLVPLANKPILFFGLEAIAAAGIREVGIVVGDTEDAFRAAVGDGSQFGLEVTYLRQDAPRGLAHAVLIARDFLADEPFLMYLGDNLVVGGVTGFVQEFDRSQPDALVLLAHVDRPEQFGVAELDADGRLVRLVEKPKVPPSDLALVGCYLFGPAVHDAVRAIEPSIAASSRSPTRSSGSSRTARWSRARSSRRRSSTPASSRISSRRTRSCSARWRAASTVPWTTRRSSSGT